MQRLTLTAQHLRPAPLAQSDREAEVRGVLAAHGLFPRRMSHASTVGLTITYAHLSERADLHAAAEVLAVSLDWEDTTIEAVASMVTVSTSRG